MLNLFSIDAKVGYVDLYYNDLISLINSVNIDKESAIKNKEHFGEDIKITNY